jgi:hypothetical protein
VSLLETMSRGRYLYLKGRRLRKGGKNVLIEYFYDTY